MLWMVVIPLGWFADGSANPSSSLRLVDNSCMSLVRSVSSATAAGRLPSPAGGTQTKSVEKLAAHALCPFPHNVPIVSPIIETVLLQAPLQPLDAPSVVDDLDKVPWLPDDEGGDAAWPVLVLGGDVGGDDELNFQLPAPGPSPCR